MLKQNDRCTGLHCMEETLSYLALEGWYNIDSAKVIKLLSTTDKRGSTHRAHLVRLHKIQDEPIIRPMSHHVYRLRETQPRGVCRSIILTSLRPASEEFGIPNFGKQFRMQIAEDWRHQVSRLVLGYDHNILLDIILIKLQHGLLYCHLPFHNTTSVQRLGPNCKVECTNANQGIMPEAPNIWVQ